MKTTTAYISVRLDIEYDETLFTQEDAVQEAVQETDYSFNLDRSDLKISSTDICGIVD